MHYNLKVKDVLTRQNFQIFWPFIYKTMAIWGPENVNGYQSANSKVYQLQKYKFVKTVTSCTYYMFSL